MRTSHELAIRNAIAKEFDPYHDAKDPEAWLGADIPTRESIDNIIRAIHKILHEKKSDLT